MERRRFLSWSGWIEINATLRHFPLGPLFFDLRQRGKGAPRTGVLERYGPVPFLRRAARVRAPFGARGGRAALPGYFGLRGANYLRFSTFLTSISIAGSVL
jgi:hypothetical protein